MRDPKRPEDRAFLRVRQPAALSPGNVVEPLDLREVAERWGWKYGTAADRVYKAANAGQLRVIQRPGRQKYYLSDELVAVFGMPPDITDTPAYGARYPSWLELADLGEELAS